MSVTIDFNELCPEPNLPFGSSGTVVGDARRWAGFAGKIYAAAGNGWLSIYNPDTHVFDDWFSLHTASGAPSGITNTAMCAKDGYLWVASEWSAIGNDRSIYQVSGGGVVTKHTWDTTTGPRSILSLQEDPVDSCLYFVTDNLPESGAYGIVRFNIGTGTFETVIDADTMWVNPSRLTPTGTGFQIRDCAVASDQRIYFCGNARTDPDLEYGEGFTAFTEPGSKPLANTTDAVYFTYWATIATYELGDGTTAREVPMTNAELGGSYYCVPYMLTIGPDDKAYFSWQVDWVTG